MWRLEESDRTHRDCESVEGKPRGEVVLDDLALVLDPYDATEVIDGLPPTAIAMAAVTAQSVTVVVAACREGKRRPD